MKKRLIALALTVAVTVGACITLFSVSAETQNTENTSSVEKTQVEFTLKAYGNSIALYDKNDVLLVYEDVVLSALPPADRTALEQGISITDFDQLNALIEDFDG